MEFEDAFFAEMTRVCEEEPYEITESAHKGELIAPTFELLTTAVKKHEAEPNRPLVENAINHFVNVATSRILPTIEKLYENDGDRFANYRFQDYLYLATLIQSSKAFANIGHEETNPKRFVEALQRELKGKVQAAFEYAKKFVTPVYIDPDNDATRHEVALSC